MIRATAILARLPLRGMSAVAGPTSQTYPVDKFDLKQVKQI